MVKASASRAEDSRFESRLLQDFSRVESYQFTSKLALQWLSCQAPGIIGSVPGLVAQCQYTVTELDGKLDRYATSISVQQYVKLSEQIRPTIHCNVAGTLSNQQTTSFNMSYYNRHRYGQTVHCSLHLMLDISHWPLGPWIGQSVTALIACRKEELVNIAHPKVGNDLCSSSTKHQHYFKGNLEETAEWWGAVLPCHFELKLKLHS